MKKSFLLILLALLLAATAQASSKYWVHVYIEGNGEKAEKVKVNIPISLVETMLPMIEEKGLEKGKLRLQEKDLNIQELRKVWKALREEGDGEYVSIESKETNMRVFTQGNYFLVETKEGSKANVNIKIPLSVVDAMLSGEGEELNLVAAVKALKDSGVRDIISVKDKDTMVRVWIDENNQIR